MQVGGGCGIAGGASGRLRCRGGGVLGRPVGFQRRHALQSRTRGTVGERPGSIERGAGARVVRAGRLKDGQRLSRAFGGVAGNDTQLGQGEREVALAGRHTRTLTESQPLINATVVPDGGPKGVAPLYAWR